MIYIRKVRLVNLKNHPDNVVEFSDGINVIVGQSDMGKSNIGTGIKWVFSELSSTPDHMIGPISDRCCVHVLLADDQGNEWNVEKHSKHGNRKNVYFVDGVMYQSSHNKIPPEVRKLDPFVRIEVNGKKFTPQLYEQGAPGWMIDASSTDRLGLCAYGTDMAPLEEMRRDLNKAVARDAKVLESKKAELESLDSKIEDLQFVSSWRSKLNAVKMKQKKLRMLESGMKSIEEYESIQQQLDSMPADLPVSVIDDYISSLKNALYLINMKNSLEQIQISMPEPQDMESIDRAILLSQRANVMLQYTSLIKENLDSLESVRPGVPIQQIDQAIVSLRSVSTSMSLGNELKDISESLSSLEDSIPATQLEEAIQKLSWSSKVLNHKAILEQILSEKAALDAVDEQNNQSIAHIMEALGEIKTCPTCGQTVEAW